LQNLFSSESGLGIIFILISISQTLIIIIK
jgi:hypothetical protein